MLKIENLYVKAGNKTLLNDLSLSVPTGQLHAVMGPNGAGKSTLVKVIAGHPDYQVVSGKIFFEINFKYQDITKWDPDKRAKEGVFMSFQYPVEIEGISNYQLLKTAFKTLCTHQGTLELTDDRFLKLVKEKAELVGSPMSFLDRPLNAGFSGGEKKRNEILQLAVLSPRLALLDETDSGLDVDSMNQIAKALTKLKNKNNSFLLITHYDHLLKFLKPDRVHILKDGKIYRSGDHTLVKQTQERGFVEI